MCRVGVDRWPVGVEAVQEVVEIDGGELPFERLGCLVVACFERGEAFDAPGTIRISYATSMELLKEGSTRVLAFVAKHAPQTAATR